MTAASVILARAGWFLHPEWGAYENGTMVAGVTPDQMTLHIKDWARIPPGHALYSADTPDTAEEAATWLVDLFGRTKTAPTMEVASDETDSEAGAQESGSEGIGDGLSPSAVDAGAITASGRGGESPIDAEFSDAELADLARLEALLEPMLEGGDVLAIGEDIKDFVPDEIVEHPGGAFLFGDNLPLQRVLFIGRVTEIAHELKAALQAGWSIDDFRSLQNLIMRIDRGEASDEPEARARFQAISDRSRAMSTVDAHAEGQVAYIRSAERDALEVYDPEIGWPELGA